ncbi:MAG: hypothetical protein FJ356_03875 [Thaumarchaeota archaeon]|nr:hypothetical protein [Nitrososphaerota archaeon]
MRTVSTKLDNVDHERLLEICNEDGKTVSEWLRDLIQRDCKAWEEGKEIESEQIQQTQEPPKVTQWKLYDDHGKLISSSENKSPNKQKVVINV